MMDIGHPTRFRRHIQCTIQSLCLRGKCRECYVFVQSSQWKANLCWWKSLKEHYSWSVATQRVRWSIVIIVNDSYSFDNFSHISLISLHAGTLYQIVTPSMFSSISNTTRQLRKKPLLPQSKLVSYFFHRWC